MIRLLSGHYSESQTVIKNLTVDTHQRTVVKLVDDRCPDVTFLARLKEALHLNFAGPS